MLKKGSRSQQFMFSFIKKVFSFKEHVSEAQLGAWVSLNKERLGEKAVGFETALAVLKEQIAPDPILDADEESVRQELRVVRLDLVNFESGPDMQAVLDMKQKIRGIVEKMTALKQPIAEKFSEAKPALEAYLEKTINQRELVSSYIKEPIETLARDRTLAIVQILIAAEKPVFSKEELNAFMKSYGALMRERTYAIQDLDQMPAFHQHANAKSRLQLLEQKLKELTERRAQTLNALEQRKQVARDQLKTLSEEFNIKLF